MKAEQWVFPLMLILGICALWHAVGGHYRMEVTPALDGVAIEIQEEINLGEGPVGWHYKQPNGLSIVVTAHTPGKLSVFVSGPIEKFNADCDPSNLIMLSPMESCRFKIDRVHTYLWWYKKEVGGVNNIILVIGQG